LRCRGRLLVDELVERGAELVLVGLGLGLTIATG
jgi:hypothetical protein